MCVCVSPAGIFCLLRTSFVIVLMSREWATHSIPTLILLGIFLYVDRVVRQELIFDSSALTSTVFVTHVLNICRSKIAHVDIDPSSNAAAAVTLLLQHGNQSSVALSNDNAAAPVDSWWWQQQVVLSAYCIVSTLLLLEIDISALSAAMLLQCTTAAPRASEASSFLPTTNAAGSKQREEQLQQQQHQQRRFSCLSNHCTKKSGLHISTIVLHCLFVGTLLQIPVTKQDFMVPWKIMLRSFLFLVLALGWTYSVGVYDTSWQQQQESMVMIVRRRTRSYPYFLHDGTLVVQPFTQCQLRFLVLLFLDSWFLVATGAAMTCIVVHNVSILFAHISSPSAAATTQRNGFFASTQAAAPVQKKKKKQGALPSSYSPACAAAAPVLSSGTTEAHDLDTMMHQRHYHHCQPSNSAAAATLIESAASAKEGDEDEDEMAAMFRLARQAAAGKMGEQI